MKLFTAATSAVTIQYLRGIFATHSLPEVLATDSGTPFTSSKFEIFMVNSGIRRVTSSPCHLVSNGLAERSLQMSIEHILKSLMVHWRLGYPDSFLEPTHSINHDRGDPN